MSCLIQSEHLPVFGELNHLRQPGYEVIFREKKRFHWEESMKKRKVNGTPLQPKGMIAPGTEINELTSTKPLGCLLYHEVYCLLAEV